MFDLDAAIARRTDRLKQARREADNREAIASTLHDELSDLSMTRTLKAVGSYQGDTVEVVGERERVVVKVLSDDEFEVRTYDLSMGATTNENPKRTEKLTKLSLADHLVNIILPLRV